MLQPIFCHPTHWYLSREGLVCAAGALFARRALFTLTGCVQLWLFHGRYRSLCHLARPRSPWFCITPSPQARSLDTPPSSSRFGEVREALVDNGKRAATVQQSKPVRPVRRRCVKSSVKGKMAHCGVLLCPHHARRHQSVVTAVHAKMTYKKKGRLDGVLCFILFVPCQECDFQHAPRSRRPRLRLLPAPAAHLPILAGIYLRCQHGCPPSCGLCWPGFHHDFFSRSAGWFAAPPTRRILQLAHNTLNVVVKLPPPATPPEVHAFSQEAN